MRELNNLLLWITCLTPVSTTLTCSDSMVRHLYTRQIDHIDPISSSILCVSGCETHLAAQRGIFVGHTARFSSTQPPLSRWQILTSASSCNHPFMHRRAKPLSILAWSTSGPLMRLAQHCQSASCCCATHRPSISSLSPIIPCFKVSTAYLPVQAIDWS